MVGNAFSDRFWTCRWAEDNECLLNPGFMRSTCVKACHVAFACGDDFLVRPSQGHNDEATQEAYFARADAFPSWNMTPTCLVAFAEISGFDGLRNHRGN